MGFKKRKQISVSVAGETIDFLETQSRRSNGLASPTKIAATILDQHARKKSKLEA